MVLSNICLKKETVLWRHSSNNDDNSYHFTERLLNARHCTGYFFKNVTHIFCLIPTQREMCYYCSHFQMKKVKLREIKLTKGAQLRNSRPRIGIPVRTPKYSTTRSISCSELAEEPRPAPFPGNSQAVCLAPKSLCNSLFLGFLHLDQTWNPKFPLGL